MIKKCLAVRHVAFEDLGLLGPLLAARGYDVHYLDAGVQPFDAETLLTPDLLIVLGGPIGVYERDAYPFIADEIAAMAARLAVGQTDAWHLPRRADHGGGARRARGAGPGQGNRLGAIDVDGRRPSLGTFAPSARRRCCTGTATIASCRQVARGSPRRSIVRCRRSCARRRSSACSFIWRPSRRGSRSWLVGHTVELGKAGIDPRDLRRQARTLGPATREARTAKC